MSGSLEKQGRSLEVEIERWLLPPLEPPFFFFFQRESSGCPSAAGARLRPMNPASATIVTT